jgi:phosphate-selective porin OprO and OprP
MLRNRILFLFSLISLALSAKLLFAKDAVVGIQTSSPASSNASRSPITYTGISKASSKKKTNSDEKKIAVAQAEVPASVEATPKKEEAPKNTGYDKGFFIQSSDGKYRLNFNGYIQTLFEYDRTKGDNIVGFRIQNARVTFSGHLATPKLTYKLQLNFAKFKDGLLLDAWMQYRFNQALELRFGQQDVPWIRQAIISSSNLQFVDRSLATIEFLNVMDTDTNGDGVADKQIRDGRDIGLVVQGTPFNKKVEYNVGFFNGSGTNSTNFNNSLLYTGRAVYNIIGDYGYEEGDYNYSDTPQAFFGGSGNYNVRDFTDRKITQFGSETGLKYKGFSAQGEFFFRHSTTGNTTLGTANDYGYYAQLGYFAVPKRLEFSARSSQVFLQGIQNDKAEFNFGITGYPLRNKFLRLQSDYSVLPVNTKQGVDTSQRFRLQVQTKF